MGIEAAIAGEVGVPVTLVTGDDKVCAEATALLGEAVETCVTKFGIARYRALCKPLSATRLEIREAVAPLDLGRPVAIRVAHKTPSDVDRLASRQAGVRRIDALTSEQTFDRLSDCYGGQWEKQRA